MHFTDFLFFEVFFSFPFIHSFIPLLLWLWSTLSRVVLLFQNRLPYHPHHHHLHHRHIVIAYILHRYIHWVYRSEEYEWLELTIELSWEMEQEGIFYIHLVFFSLLNIKLRYNISIIFLVSSFFFLWINIFFPPFIFIYYGKRWNELIYSQWELQF